MREVQKNRAGCPARFFCVLRLVLITASFRVVARYYLNSDSYFFVVWHSIKGVRIPCAVQGVISLLLLGVNNYGAINEDLPFTIFLDDRESDSCCFEVLRGQLDHCLLCTSHCSFF